MTKPIRDNFLKSLITILKIEGVAGCGDLFLFLIWQVVYLFVSAMSSWLCLHWV